MVMSKVKSEATNTPEARAMAVQTYTPITIDDIKVDPIEMLGEWVAIVPVDERKHSTIVLTAEQSKDRNIGVIVGCCQATEGVKVGDAVAYLARSKQMEIPYKGYPKPVQIVSIRNVFCKVNNAQL